MSLPLLLVLVMFLTLFGVVRFVSLFSIDVNGSRPTIYTNVD